MNEPIQHLFADYPDVVSVDMLCAMLGGISKKLAYRLLADAEIKSLKIGRNYRIPKSFVIDYLIAGCCGGIIFSQQKAI